MGGYLLFLHRGVPEGVRAGSRPLSRRRRGALRRPMGMNEGTARVSPPPIPEDVDRSGEGPRSLYALAAGLVVAATAWFLLKELAPLLRPLILAVFLAYLVVPVQRGLRRRISSSASA